MRIGERGPAFGKFGIDGQRLFEKRDPLGKSTFHADLLDHRPRLKIERVCLAVVGHLARGRRGCGEAKGPADRGDDIGADDLAPIKEILDRTAEPVRPDLGAGLAADQRHADADALRVAPDFAFDQVGDAKIGRDFRQRSAFVDDRRNRRAPRQRDAV